ncbi:YjgP/YjgQ family permease [Vicingus serpentipes]|uniref:YjgP/YjgQ family permease n=1 Tax=Vicingus serpentipes TaxID=1926625 RepID=A0A5C6RWJ3_9FLAO|nr:LptF/LptG family permease [Vicingus serpentipes]TXB66701.1 YjgP/YjgQ family permease [Vicingus serpentipes]
MKKASLFIIKSFIGPFIMTFFIALFVLLMQFIWLYIDDMLGKGLEWYVIAELLMYASASLVPLAMPLSILLASLMTFGNLGEHFELVSFKAAGISLQKVMQPLIVLVSILSIGAFFFANNVIPVANLKFYSLFHDIRSQKPAFNILPDVFYNEIDGYVIRVKGKEIREEGDLLKDVMIYNHTENQGNRQLTIADSAIMKMSNDKSYFSIKLFNGIDYQEKYEGRRDKIYPLSRFIFEEHEMRIDMSGFKMDRTDEELFKEDYRMLNLDQLANKTDTLKKYQNKRTDEFFLSIHNSYLINDTLTKKTDNDSLIYASMNELINTFSKEEKQQVYSIALNAARTNKGRASAAMVEMDYQQENLLNIQIEWHRKFTFSIACLIMFFIGAPLGAIVQKGGLGMPVVISVVFFLLFWILSMMGEKSAKEMVIEPYQGMWLATAVLFPLGIFFTYKATTDSAMFNLDSYLSFFKKLFKKKK